MKFLLSIALLAATAVANGADAPDPYPDSGGLFRGTPSEADIRSGRANFTPEKCNAFVPGRTSKAELVARLGPPAGWMSNEDGTSALEYDYLAPEVTFGIQRVIHAMFSFDGNRTLFQIRCPGFDQAVEPAGVRPYVCNAPVPPLPAASGATLTLNYWYSKDREHVYYRGNVMPGADPATFRLACCEGCETCGEDKNRCYWSSTPVPCSCRAMSPNPYSKATLRAAPGDAIVAGASLSRVPEGTHRSIGYLVAPPGSYSLDTTCPRTAATQGPGVVQLPIKLEAGVYRLDRTFERGTGICSTSWTRPAMIVGRVDAPEVWLRSPETGEPERLLVLEPGHRTVTVLCREVTKPQAHEDSVEMTLDLVAGQVVWLGAEFAAPDFRCRPAVMK